MQLVHLSFQPRGRDGSVGFSITESKPDKVGRASISGCQLVDEPQNDTTNEMTQEGVAAGARLKRKFPDQSRGIIAKHRLAMSSTTKTACTLSFDAIYMHAALAT